MARRWSWDSDPTRAPELSAGHPTCPGPRGHSSGFYRTLFPDFGENTPELLSPPVAFVSPKSLFGPVLFGGLSLVGGQLVVTR